MSTWKVEQILSGNKIRVKPNWKWKGKKGHEVIILGYSLSLKDLPKDLSRELAESLAIDRLTDTIKDKDVVLRNPSTVDDSNVIHCQVFLNDVDISKYFVDFDK